MSNIEREARNNKKKDPERIIIEGSSLGIFSSSLQSSRAAVDRLETLLDQLDPLTRPRRSRRTFIVAQEIIQNVLAILEPDLEKANIKVKPLTGNNKVLAWEADLFHAVYNLLHNSIYWTQKKPPDDRKVEIEVRLLEEKQNEENPKIEIIISDNGSGIKQQSAPLIFDLGYTEKPDGYGVGLFIAREAIERSGGTIDLLNPGEKGAKFRIILGGQQNHVNSTT